MPPRHARIVLPALTLSLALIGGCSSSLDEAVYTSTPHQPTTLVLYETVDEQVVWEKPIPEWHQIKLDFDRDDEWEHTKITGLPATAMSWEMHRMRGYTPGEHGINGEKVEEGAIELAGEPVMLRVLVGEEAEAYEPVLPSEPAVPSEEDTEAEEGMEAEVEAEAEEVEADTDVVEVEAETEAEPAAEEPAAPQPME